MAQTVVDFCMSVVDVEIAVFDGDGGGGVVFAADIDLRLYLPFPFLPFLSLLGAVVPFFSARILDMQSNQQTRSLR